MTASMTRGPAIVGPTCPWPLCCLSLPNVPCENVRRMGQMCPCQHCVVYRKTKRQK